jgi:hypothetical protein
MVTQAALGWPVVGAGEWDEWRDRFLSGLDEAAELGEGDLARRHYPAIEFPAMAEYKVRDAVEHIAVHNAHHFLKNFWQKLFTFNAVFGLTLILIWGVLRFIIVLNANNTGNYQWVSLVFISMWVAPFIFLNKGGRKKIASVSLKSMPGYFFHLCWASCVVPLCFW